MTSYRTVQAVRDRMVPLQQALNAACLAKSTQEISTYSTTAMALVDEILRELQTGGSGSDAGQENRHNQNLLQAAVRALTLAWESAEKISLGTSVDDMRARALEFKTQADFADAYVSAALGTEL